MGLFVRDIKTGSHTCVPKRVSNILADFRGPHTSRLIPCSAIYDTAMAQRRTELQGLVSHAIARRKEKERIGKIQRKVKTYFSSKYHLRFNRFVGDGNHGGTGVFSANKPAPPKPQQTPTTFSDPEKFIVKFSLGVTPNGDDGDQHLRNEAQWLRYLDGSEHFIASKAINHLEIKKSEERAIKDGEGTESSRKKKNQDNGAGGAPLGDGVLAALVSALGITSPAESGSNSQDHQDHKVIPFIILEYLPLGDLEQLRERMWTRWRWSGQPIPSRLLWGLLLCRKCFFLSQSAKGGNSLRKLIRTLSSDTYVYRIGILHGYEARPARGDPGRQGAVDTGAQLAEATECSPRSVKPRGR